jgi:hypothetical protein
VTLTEWLAENQGTVLRTLPRKGDAHPELYVVELYAPRGYQGPLWEKLEDDKRVVVINHPATWHFNVMPPYWRRKLFPERYERWEEHEHAGKRRLLTWEQQQNVWFHMDAGEDWAAGKTATEAYERLMANAEPLPRIDDMMAAFHLARARSRVHHVKPQPGVKAPAPSEQVKPVTPRQLADAQQRIDRLRAAHPDATPGQILAMLETK